MSFKLYMLCEFIALGSCIYNYQVLSANFRMFLIYLVLICAYEIGNRFKLFIWHHTSAVTDNIESILEMTIFGLFVASLEELSAYKSKIQWVVAAGVMVYLIDIFFIQGIWKMATVGIVTQCAIITVLICIYYYHLIKYEDENIKLLTYPPFWATIALLFYSLVDFFYYGMFSYLISTNNVYIYKVVTVFGNLSSIVLYLFLAVSFFCFRWQKKMT